jgi:hypothetical protein
LEFRVYADFLPSADLEERAARGEAAVKAELRTDGISAGLGLLVISAWRQ